MGLLRFLLAVSVIIAHSQPFHGLEFVGGPLAVEAFFMISGFYIGMILRQKYVGANGSYWLFISNRFLRIFPLYWLALILTIVVSLIIPNYNIHAFIDNTSTLTGYGDKLSFTSWLIVIIGNVLIFFQDLVMYLGVNLNTGNFYFTRDFHESKPFVLQFMLVQQAWSVALELMFYLVAPFIVRRKPWVIATIMIISFGLKFYGNSIGFGNDPWSYRFFPFELGYFLAGTLAFLVYNKYVKKTIIPKFIGLGLYLFVGCITIFASKLQFRHADLIYLLVIFVSMPYLFNYTKSFKRDKFIGELSYPIYLTHLIVINALAGLSIFWHRDLLTLFFTIALSSMMIKFISNAIEHRRQKRLITADN